MYTAVHSASAVKSMLFCTSPVRERGPCEKRRVVWSLRLQFLTGATCTWRSDPSQHHRMLPHVVGAVLPVHRIGAPSPNCYMPVLKPSLAGQSLASCP
jgi:hypothetical protein